MTSSSCFAIVSVAVVLQYLLLVCASVSTSPEYIDAICKNIYNNDDVTKIAFCLKILKSHPPVAKASNKIQAADAALGLVMSYAEKSAGFIEKAATKNPNLKKQFKACQDAYVSIIRNLKSASGELKVDPQTANYDAMVCYDQTTIVRKSVGENKDKASQTVIEMTVMMENLIGIAVGATRYIDG